MSSEQSVKNVLTEQIRQGIKNHVSTAQETDEAEAGSDALSFQSTVCPERHVWIDTSVEGIGVDLEDWDSDDEWDNAVARVLGSSPDETVELVQIWLSGANLEDYYLDLNKAYKRLTKKKQFFAQT